VGHFKVSYRDPCHSCPGCIDVGGRSRKVGLLAHATVAGETEAVAAYFVAHVVAAVAEQAEAVASYLWPLLQPP
jgi:hypothetical protein